jgi:hypothetical protein
MFLELKSTETSSLDADSAAESTDIPALLVTSTMLAASARTKESRGKGKSESRASWTAITSIFNWSALYARASSLARRSAANVGVYEDMT